MCESCIQNLQRSGARPVKYSKEYHDRTHRKFVVYAYVADNTNIWYALHADARGVLYAGGGITEFDSKVVAENNITASLEYAKKKDYNWKREEYAIVDVTGWKVIPEQLKREQIRILTAPKSQILVSTPFVKNAWTSLGEAKITYSKPSAIPENNSYRTDAWKAYTVEELGQWVHLLAKRATMRTDQDKKAKDIDDAQNYLNMMQSHLNALKETL